MACSSEEVCLSVAAFFKRNRISYDDAARALGQSKQTIYNRISSKKYFSPSVAKRWWEAFGFSEAFLVSGRGELMEEEGIEPSDNFPEGGDVSSQFDYPEELIFLAADRLFALVEDKDIKGMWNSLLSGDMTKFMKYQNNLVKRKGEKARLPVFLTGKLARVFGRMFRL